MAKRQVPGIIREKHPDQFREAISRFAGDAEFREEAMSNPEVVQDNFKLSLEELQALRQVAILSGADVSNVDRLRIDSIRKFVERGDLAAVDVDVSCCSCCCCCCGETAVLTIA